jgi:aspartyl protease
VAVHKCLAGCVLVVAAALAGSAQARSLETVPRRIPVRLVGGRLVVVPVTVNGTGPYPFLLDTGATSSMIDEVLAARLTLPRVGAAIQETATSATRVDVVRTTLTLGSVERDGDVLRAPLDAVRAVDPTIRGILGQDVLRRGNWWLDFRSASLVEDHGGELGTAFLGERLSVHWHADRPAIDAVLPDRHALRLVLDSAASSPILFRDTRGASAPAGEAVVTTLGDAQTVCLRSFGPLRAGGAAIPRVSAAILPDAGPGREEDGLLPAGLFEGIYFDNRAGVVVLNPRRSLLSALR